MPQAPRYCVSANPSKAGRLLFQLSATAIEEAMGIPWNEIRHPYLVVFEEMNAAGNHFHRRKRELICVARGTVRVTLEDLQTRHQEVIVLSTDPTLGVALGIAVPLGIAHAVTPLTPDATLLVFATAPAREPDDDFTYAVSAPR